MFRIRFTKCSVSSVRINYPSQVSAKNTSCMRSLCVFTRGKDTKLAISAPPIISGIGSMHRAPNLLFQLHGICCVRKSIANITVSPVLRLAFILIYSRIDNTISQCYRLHSHTTITTSVHVYWSCLLFPYHVSPLGLWVKQINEIVVIIRRNSEWWGNWYSARQLLNTAGETLKTF